MGRFAFVGFLNHFGIVFLKGFQFFPQVGNVSLIDIDLLSQKIGLLVVDPDQITSNGYFDVEILNLGEQGLFFSGVFKKQAVVFV